MIQTRSGTKIILNDTEGSVFIEGPNGNTYLMDENGNINVTVPKNISFTTGENVNISAGKSINSSANQDINNTAGNDMKTRVGNDHSVHITNNHTFNSNDYQQNVKGNKTINVGGSLKESTAETTHRAKSGDILIQSPVIAQVLGKIDAKLTL